jgi:transcriptional regulator with XRE-family HTH domain
MAPGENDVHEQTDALTQQYLRLIHNLGDDLGYARGWKQRVAKRLGITPSYLSKILVGERRVGLDVAERAERALGLDPGSLVAFGMQDQSDAGSLPRSRGDHRSLLEIERLAERITHRFGDTKQIDLADVHALARAILTLPMVEAAHHVLHDGSNPVAAAGLATTVLAEIESVRRAKT